MSFWTWLKGVKDKITAFFDSDAGQIVKDGLANVVETLAPAVSQILFQMAFKEVLRVDKFPDLTGDQKFGEVKKQLLAYAKSQGLKIAENQVDLAIKMGVEALRKRSGGN